MEPILKELSEEYDGRAVIEVIDLNEHEEAAAQYGVQVIPTQIFFDAAGNEVWRHQGFLSKNAIVEKLTELGVGPVDQ
jgi:thioredoxin 1